MKTLTIEQQMAREVRRQQKLEYNPRPVNRMAAIVAHKRGISDDVEFKKARGISSSTPLPVVQWHGKREFDLTGKRFGRITVIGCSHIRRQTRSSARSKWVVRCDCGRYELRRTKSLKRNKNSMCMECSYAASKYKI